MRTVSATAIVFFFLVGAFILQPQNGDTYCLIRQMIKTMVNALENLQFCAVFTRITYCVFDRHQRVTVAVQDLKRNGSWPLHLFRMEKQQFLSHQRRDSKTLVNDFCV